MHLSGRNGPLYGSLPDALLNNVADSYAMIIVVFNAYTKSDWCLQELEYFKQTFGVEGLRQRLYVVALSKSAMDDIVARPGLGPADLAQSAVDSVLSRRRRRRAGACAARPRRLVATLRWAAHQVARCLRERRQGRRAAHRVAAARAVARGAAQRRRAATRRRRAAVRRAVAGAGRGRCSAWPSELRASGVVGRASSMPIRWTVTSTSSTGPRRWCCRSAAVASTSSPSSSRRAGIWPRNATPGSTRAGRPMR